MTLAFLGLLPMATGPAPRAPIRSELFSVERLEQHAQSLAAVQQIDANPRRGNPIAKRLHDNARTLAEAYRAIVVATANRQPIMPAARWLLDSFYIVEKQVRQIENDLPPGYYWLLPKLSEGPLKGYPRVSGIAWALVAHTDSTIDIQKLTRFVEAYQRTQPLMIGELWALAITLRITLVENLRRLAEAIVAQLTASELADALADRILDVALASPKSDSAIAKSLDQSPWSTAFAVELSQRLRDRDPNSTPALRWLDNRLQAEGTTTEQIVREELHRQSAIDVTVQNVINSMRLISMINWPEFVESVSTVNRVLLDACDFGAMDFPTRDLYRRAIEKLSRQCRHDESEVAKLAIASASRAAARPGSEAPAIRRENTPGYYLIAEGRIAFEKELGCRIPLGTKLFRFQSNLGVASYIGLLAIATAAVLTLALLLIGHAGAGGWMLACFAILGIVPASDVAVAVVNRVIAQSVDGTLLPALELRKGVTPDLRTIIVVPTLLTNKATIEGQIDRLEVHHLSNSDENFVFALLTDWRDCATERDADDRVLLSEAAAGIARLNALYAAADSSSRFFLFHRKRVWNESEQMWMGWERKRGKLHELNRLLGGASDTTFLPVEGEAIALPPDIRFVITLDADTRLPIGAARRLVGKMSHPLNRPWFDAKAGVVVQGHGIMQPRVTPSLPIGSEGSLFQRAFTGPNGLDPYAMAISDVYQDMFGEGSYVGKGIYEIESFEAALEGQIPENSVLSHDLLEGVFARAGLASDIELVEEFPSRYDVSAARQHRWVRGDWQLLPWAFGFQFHNRGGARRPALPWLGRWKLLDNLRRSLSAPAAFLSLLVAWLQPLAVAELWTGYIILTIAAPPVLPALAGILPHGGSDSIRSHLRRLQGDFALAGLRIAFLATFLAHQSFLMVDATGRTLIRLFVSRRHLLQWVTSFDAGEESIADGRGVAVQISGSIAFAALVAVAIYLSGERTWALAAPFALLWILSPLVARWASLPPPGVGRLSIAPADALALRLVARRTWRFFETFVVASDNMLPPDNFQEDPEPVVAHRTSPTNIGLYLLTAIAARDFGWVGTLDAMERLEGAFASLHRMERFRGHFYNWYNSSDLSVLEPKYVSTVDSGNLAGHLIVLRQACIEYAAGPVVTPSWVSGLADTLAVLHEALREFSATKPKAPPAAIAAFNNAIAAMSASLIAPPLSPVGAARRLAEMTSLAAALVDCARVCAPEAVDGADVGIVIWSLAVSRSVLAHRRDFDFLMPWASLLALENLAGGEIVALLDAMPALAKLPDHCAAALQLLANNPERSGTEDTSRLERALVDSQLAARTLLGRLGKIADFAQAMFAGMEFGFLFDPSRELLSIGYRGADGSLDLGAYDLLASEARLTSYVAIAKGDLPAKHWFRLGRTMTPVGRGSALISWSGSMFEYLMPSLVMRAPHASLLAQTNRLIVSRQEQYGDGLGVPWGISESAYNARDIENAYQYSSFGVPDLGYKRGLAESVVIAPYASGLASMVDPAAATRNLARLAGIGGSGPYGWYEALDYTRARIPEKTRFVVIRAYMAHHQGMIIVAIANAVNGGRMRARFHDEPIIRAAELLLQERAPRGVALANVNPQGATETASATGLAPAAQRKYASPHFRIPLTHLLSNGRYSTMIASTGSGYSKWGDIAITRWREDVTCDNWGAFIFLRDLRGGEAWSAGYQPCRVEPDSYEVTFQEDRAEITRTDDDLTTTLEVMVSAEDDGGVHRISVTNHGDITREIEITSYAEIALARQADDMSHPAFSKLFVETEFVPHLGAILATRRQRSAADPLIWAAHLAVVEGESSGDMQFETDRARFIGRGQSVRSPTTISDRWPLSNTVGAVLDPIFSLRRRLRIPRGATARVAFWTLAANSREGVLDLADKHHDVNSFERAKTLAWTRAQIELRHLGITTDETHLFQRLANHVLYANSALRPVSKAIARGAAKASTLWKDGVSGDRPIVLVRVQQDDDLEIVRLLLRGHEYWRLKQLAVDLVILNDQASSYVQDFQTELDTLVRTNQSAPRMAGDDARGAVHTLRADLISPESLALLPACARAVLYGGRGSLAAQLNYIGDLRAAEPPYAHRAPRSTAAAEAPASPELEFFNGLGGFAKGGREYLTRLQDDAHTPAPWVNVVANPSFGFQASSEGSGFTWSANSQQNQLTRWSNDPVGDGASEAIYVRDDDTGDLWGPTALPIRHKGAQYLATHGQGYCQFEHNFGEISLEYTQFVPVSDSIKISRLKITNGSARPRRLSITAYVEWVLGASGGADAPFLVTEIDSETRAIFARNPWSESFSDRIAFMDLGGRQTSWTADRTEFLGRDGAMSGPKALAPGTTLSGRVGAALDPCGALQSHVTLNPLGRQEIVFCLGQSASRGEAQALIKKYRSVDLDTVFAAVTEQWDDILGAVQVKTPDRALDIMVNRWLPYQTLACRVWARAGFYQASGAYGFRDQLQDVMALCVLRPAVAREHLLRAAGRQFVEGDVQHWWLPESGKGIRTRIKDDRIWLAYVVAHYLETTDDVGVLTEVVPYLEGPTLRDDQHDGFFEPKTSDKTATLFEHCALALDASLEMGTHGLPLMGAGDWNDGLDRVGQGGKGESIWLGWFLAATLNAFAGLAERTGAAERGAGWRKQVSVLAASLDGDAWDGDWYRRAFFDDGELLGSVSNSECRVDSIAQSWAVISGVAQPARAVRAMSALDKYLVRRDVRLSLLFTPPFNHPSHDPGYIKGYPPGIRENGGQYTHGAVWAALAFAMQGDGDRAGELLSMLNPIHNAETANDVQRYKVEPYVACADVYSESPHVGRGGWTWYTGSAGWMYRVFLEYLLGFRVQGASLRLDPCIPKHWPGFHIVFRHRSATYEIGVDNPFRVSRGVLAIRLDGQMLKDGAGLVPLVDDGATHRVQVVLGS